MLDYKRIGSSPLMTCVYPPSDRVKALGELEKNTDGEVLREFLEG